MYFGVAGGVGRIIVSAVFPQQIFQTSRKVRSIVPAADFLVVAVRKLADVLSGARVAFFRVGADVAIRRLFEHVPKPKKHVRNSGFGCPRP